ncbi:prepilin-type N-terminal cleavage/methylation domain-containing protein [Accumulibacter sp.]|uniref:pilus assembly FimT family protein n=1 Tax=Accumulibacter sp. TaxID=2053492 RepID=UPI0028C4132F|nr:prepilin-type N-terminal cleavage/methylation domain-containing protein [Accumulibacter sp.]
MAAARNGAREAGFTTVELVVTLVIIGILAAIAIPRFQDSTAFTQRGFSDQVRATLRYAQKIAIAKRREVCVDFLPAGGGAAGRLALTFNPGVLAGGACSSVVNLPGQSAPYVVNVPTGITLVLSANFRFNGLGEAVPAPVTLTLSGRALPITVAAGTGYITN